MGDVSAVPLTRPSAAVQEHFGFHGAAQPVSPFLMGEESMERAATREETAPIKALIKEAVAVWFVFTTTAMPSIWLQWPGARPAAMRTAM